MCAFKQLYYGNDGFVVCCLNCGHFQIGFGSIVLTLTDKDFRTLYHTVRFKCMQPHDPLYDNVKSIFVPTPVRNMHFFLSKHEAMQMQSMLEKADNEEKALTLISMFND